MTCPDDAQLDRWLDDALGEAEAAAVAAHVAGCSACAARRATRLAEERLWRAALALDAAELAHLARADLAAAWRLTAAPALVRSQGASARWWPSLVILGLAAAYIAWLIALPAIEAAAGVASRLGLAGLGLGWALARLWDVAAAIGAAATNPALADPTLFMAGASLLLWLLVTRPWMSPSAE